MINAVKDENSTIEINGLNLNILDTGKGAPVLVYLHYWGGSSRTWVPVIRDLSGDYRCVAVDFRGWGQSSKEATNYQLNTLADDIVGVTDKLGLQEFILVGHSMGGKVAQIVAARQPKSLQGLILFAPAPPFPMKVPGEVREVYKTLYDTREGVEAVIGNLTPHAISDARRELIIEDGLRGSPGAKVAWPETGMIEDISATTRRIIVPVHIIVGGDDSVESETSLRANFAAISDINFTVIPGVGHMAPLEKPVELASAIRTAARALKT